MTELTDWVSSLEDLQETDLKIHRLNEQIADVPKNKEKAKSQLASYEQEVAEAKAQLTEKEKQIKNMQMDLDKFTADMQKVQTQSAMVKDNDAYRAMLNEIEHFKEQISDKEDEELEALEELDTCNSAMAKAKEHYDKQEALIQELAATHDVLVTVEENAIAGGAGAGVIEYMMHEKILKPVLNLGLPDYFVPQGTQEELYAELGLDAQGIEQAIRDYLAK